MNLDAGGSTPPTTRRLRWWPAVVTFVLTSALRYNSGAMWSDWAFGDRVACLGSLQVWRPGLLVAVATVAAFLISNRDRRAAREA